MTEDTKQLYASKSDEDLQDFAKENIKSLTPEGLLLLKAEFEKRNISIKPYEIEEGQLANEEEIPEISFKLFIEKYKESEPEKLSRLKKYLYLYSFQLLFVFSSLWTLGTYALYEGCQTGMHALVLMVTSIPITMISFLISILIHRKKDSINYLYSAITNAILCLFTIRLSVEISTSLLCGAVISYLLLLSIKFIKRTILALKSMNVI